MASFLSSISLPLLLSRVALKLRSLLFHSPRLCRIAVFSIQTIVSLNPPFYSKKRARDSDDEEARAPKSRYKHAIDVNILQAKLNFNVWKNIPKGENELDAPKSSNE